MENNINKQFIPFHKIGQQAVIVVDGMLDRGLVLSHWKGANTIEQIEADTSAEIVINALEKKTSGIELSNITATHYDIDGFIGVWSLFNPELAIQHKKLLIEIATIGDFREINFDFTDWQKALKIVCWLDETEKKLFYKPFDAANYSEENEIIACEKKFDYFLKHFTDVLLNIDNYESIWSKSFDVIVSEIKDLKENATIKTFPEIGLIYIKTNQPKPYYSLFSFTKNFDIVLTEYDNNRYELEYKYSTWVDITSRPTLPRIDLTDLCGTLNKMEQSNYKWYCDKITDTGPILRLENSELTKAERFANPTERTIYASSINSIDFINTITSYFKESYKNSSPKTKWTWNEIKVFNKKLYTNHE